MSKAENHSQQAALALEDPTSPIILWMASMSYHICPVVAAAVEIYGQPQLPPRNSN